METMESVEDEAAGGGTGGSGGGGGGEGGGPFATPNHRGQLFVDSDGIHRPLQRKNRKRVVIKLSNSEGRTPLNGGGGGGLFGGAQFDEEGDPRRLPQDPNILGRQRVLYNRSEIHTGPTEFYAGI